MEMKVEIIQKETVIPSSPTPPSKRDYKLSIIDQLTPGPYVPIVLFYSTTLNTKLSYDQLKKSLSKTLTLMYPLAGRIKDGFTIECNDKGVDFLEAKISNISLSNIVNEPKIERICQLLPCNTNLRCEKPSDQVLVSVQVTQFPCGGTSIGVCVWHLIGDASTVSTFVKTWATMNNNQESNVIENGYIVDVRGIFPPRDLSNNPLLTIVPNPEMLPFKIAMKRFIFDNSELATLIQSCPTVETGCHVPSRFEALSAFLWAKLISTWKDKESELKDYMLMTSINLRKRMVPNLPTNSMGNITYPTLAKWGIEEGELNYKKLVERVQESIRIVEDSYVRKIHEKNGYMDYLNYAIELFTTRRNEVRIASGISWCKIPFYEANFGWGKPIWITNPIKIPGGFTLLDSADGKGIEVWMGLPEEEMKLLEKNKDFLAYVSLSQDV